jgi:hypothetical protein
MTTAERYAPSPGGYHKPGAPKPEASGKIQPRPEKIAQFIDAIFRHADRNTFIQSRTFPDDRKRDAAIRTEARRTFICSECHDVEQRFVFTKHAREGEPESAQVAPPIAVEQSDNEPVPLGGEPEPAQVAPPIADEQSDNEPVPLEGEPVPAQVAPPIAGEQDDNKSAPSNMAPSIAPSSTVEERRAVTPGLFRRVIAKVRGR